MDLASYKKQTISEGKTTYKNLIISELGNRLAFLATSDSLKKEIKDYALYYFQSGADSAKLVADKYKAGIPDKWNVSENSTPSFSKNEKRLFLGIAPIQLPKDTTIPPDFEKAQLDIWHWQEPLIQPIQLVQKDRELKRTYLSYIDLDNGEKFYQLATEDMPVVRISDEDNGRYAIGLSNLKYRFETQWDIASRQTNDIWVLDLQQNTSKQIKTKVQGPTMLSPNGKYIAWYDLNDRQYYAYSIETGKEVCLTSELDINFWDEKYDMPSPPYSIRICSMDRKRRSYTCVRCL